ncbi:hypothetical protein QVD17_41722 [Tagetes erecta]|uniref:F-box associated beta-propeller type 1 domain-containing protein n=1 Tax=Tagetes erecta TaxID=13708 RepID=A0AAD8N932_TARER|nr:hypothetical protein QVD17_41722 [Tagetes erecta]
MSTSYNQMFLSIGICESSVFPVTLEQSDYLSKTQIPLPSNASSSGVRVLISFDGLVCLSFRGTHKLILWNPLTRLTKFISSTQSRGRFKQKSDAIGLYASNSNEYMLLHAKRRNDMMTLYKYSSRLDSWRKMGFIDEQKYHNYKMSWSNGTFFQGVVYFTIKLHAIGKGNYLFFFHVDSDQFKSKPFPATSHDNGEGSLVLFRKALHMFVAHGFPFWSLDLWRMDRENWTKIWVRQSIVPQSLFSYTITYIMSTDRFLVKTPYSADNHEWFLATFSGDAVYFKVSQFDMLDGIKRVIRFDVNTHKFSVLEYPRSGSLSPNGALFSWRSELYAYVSCGYFNKPLELWKLQNGNWNMTDVYRYRVL